MKTRNGYEYSGHNEHWMRTTETVWVRPSYARELEYRLRYGQPSRPELLAAASALAAYEALVRFDSRTRASVVSALKEADKIDFLAAEGAI
jgi:hypothetical protein